MNGVQPIALANPAYDVPPPTQRSRSSLASSTDKGASADNFVARV